MRSPEYDRFGPWIIEISEADPPPPLFRPYLTRDETPLLSMKIPRGIERRDAHPGMNLYDYMVTLYEEELVILERVGEDVRSAVFPCQDIQGLRYGVNLLKGNLRLVTAGKIADLPFNAVSREIMQRMVTLIRQRYTNEVRRGAITHEDDDPEDGLSFLFAHLLVDEKDRNPEFRLLASQVNEPVGALESGRLRKLLFGVIGKTLLESFHLSDGRELKSINRGQLYRYKWQTTYAVDTWYVPVSKIVGATWVTDPKNAAIVNLNLDIVGDRISFAFTRDNPSISSYARFLSAAAGSLVEASAEVTVYSPPR